MRVVVLAGLLGFAALPAVTACGSSAKAGGGAPDGGADTGTGGSGGTGGGTAGTGGGAGTGAAGTGGSAGAGGSGGTIATLDKLPLWDTAWTLELSKKSDIQTYLAARRSQGFDLVLMGYGDFDTRNTALGNGQTPFSATIATAGSPTVDVLQPNGAGWNYVSDTIGYAATQGLVICLLPLGNSSAARYVDALADQSSGENRAYRYGQWLGNRYKDVPNLVWMLGGDVDTTVNNVVALTNKLAAGIRATGDAHAITFETNGGETSSTAFNGESWLTFNAIQYRPVDPAVIASDLALLPSKPTGVAESGYETSSYGNGVSADRVLENTWLTYLSGGSYMGYGQMGMYQGQNPASTTAIDYSRIARDEVTARGWMSYKPTEDFLTLHTGTVASMRKNNSAAMIYLGGGGSVAVDLSKLDATGNVKAQRFDPRQNTATTLGTYPASGTQPFTRGSLSDAVILLDAT